MKNLLFILGSSLVRKWIEKGVNSFTGAQTVPGMPKLNTSYIGKIAKTYATLAAVGFVSLLFFVSGAVMAIHSAAQSFDLFGVFVAGAVFYTGLVLALLSLVSFTTCLLYARRADFRPDQIYVIEEEPAASQDHHQPALFRVARNIFSGVIEGWRAPIQRTYTMGETEPTVDYSQFDEYRDVRDGRKNRAS